MIRVLKKREGFTLIELMMVVAVIGILAAVLVPRIGGTKNSAKETGVDTNARIIQSLVESKISKYNADAAGAKALEDYIITTVTAYGTGQKIKNPMTDSETIISMTAALSATCAVAYHTDATAATANELSSDTTYWPTTADADYAGVVGIAAYIASNKLNVDIIPFDSTGLKGTVITITK